jgi:ASC-1-like (ASCH) protein/uncharacterized HAD superfamily protein
MRIGIDVDGTLTNIIDSVIAYGQEYEIENNLGNKLSNPKSDFIGHAFEWGNEIGNKFWKENFPKINQVEPRPLVRKYLEKLREEGHQIYIVTARSDDELNNPQKFTIKWLKKHRIPFDKVIANAVDKGPICKENNIDVFIDDLPKNCESAVANGIKTYVINSLSNENYHNEKVMRVYSFVDFYRYLSKYFQNEDGPKTYVLNVNKKYFRKLKIGSRKIDLRLNDLRRQKLAPNDIINFRVDINPDRHFFARVVKITHYKNFIELIEKEGLENCGFKGKSLKQANAIMHKYYTEEEINKYGVIAIKFKKWL